MDSLVDACVDTSMDAFTITFVDASGDVFLDVFQCVLCGRFIIIQLVLCPSRGRYDNISKTCRIKAGKVRQSNTSLSNSPSIAI